MDQNELTQSDGIIGAFQSESEPIKFLTNSSFERVILPATANWRDGKDYPEFQVVLEMSNIKHIHKREAYTFFDLIGDFGGFNDAMFLLIGLVITFYSAKAYENKIASELPVVNKKIKPTLAANFDRFRSKFSGEDVDEPITSLDQDDCRVLTKAVKVGTKTAKLPFWRAIFCSNSCSKK